MVLLADLAVRQQQSAHMAVKYDAKKQVAPRVRPTISESSMGAAHLNPTTQSHASVSVGSVRLHDVSSCWQMLNERFCVSKSEPNRFFSPSALRSGPKSVLQPTRQQGNEAPRHKAHRVAGT